MSKRKKAIFKAGVLALIAAAAVGFSAWLSGSGPRPEAPISEPPSANDIHSASWSTYQNAELGIGFEYPDRAGGLPLSKTELRSSERSGVLTSGGVTLHRDDGYGLISVTVQHPPFTTMDDWFEWRTKQVGYPVFKEGMVMIDGERAMVTHTPVEAGAPLPSVETRERTTVFFKNGTLYQIMTRGIPYEDVQRIWNSFKAG